ncbi:general transcription factor IIH subunit 3 [Lingula anatina]|uniref:General transcription factor IIH subunit 3 n=1 Tax=Lingula anatina TaxID=7574 RepID=A0A1S3JSY1_LINAN|nr:general transcription factor IIH subunit 3 [Lingula anatina]|eukprot:XP_013413480.1 general transcription factor IIH subunit 3 [Lingula anatina]
MAEGDKGEHSSLVVIVLDTNTSWWGSKQPERGELEFSQCLDAVMVFANSHLMMNHKNRLAIIAAHSNESTFLFPNPANSNSNEHFVRDGRYELFSQVNETIKTKIKSIIDGSSELYSDCLLAGALGMALCYAHRIEKECVIGEKLSSRILVIKGSEDNPSQYMNFMNMVFTSQKQNIAIDACILENDSGLLQQACDITGGIYLKIIQPQGLLQYLLWVFLPDPDMRPKLALPAPVPVDYRAACFCHRNLIDIGYVCSVCLSIFCTFSPICSTCHTTFKFKGPPKAMKRKSKKQMKAS